MQELEIKLYSGETIEVEVEEDWEIGDELDKYNVVWSGYDDAYIKEDEVVHTEDEGYISKDNSCYETKDTGNLYVSNSDLYYTQDTDEYFESDNDLYFAYDTAEYYEDRDELFLCVSDDEYYKRNDEITYLESGPYGEGWYYSDDTYYCENCDESHHNGYNCDEEESGLSNYHSERSEYYGDAEKAEFRVGMEIEKHEVVDYDEVQMLKNNMWRCEQDGSVCGGEYITPILDLNGAVEFIKKTGNGVVEDYEVNSDCGGHIHLSSNSLSPEDLYRQIEHYRQILWGIYPARCQNSYCSKNANEDCRQRDVAIRESFGTVEFRIFPGVSTMEQVEFRIGLIKFFTENFADSKEKALKVLSDKQVEFLELLDIVYPELQKKVEVLRRIYDFYEVDEKDFKKICKKASKICETLNK